MDETNRADIESEVQEYCPDRRTAITAIALAAGGVAFQLMTPSAAWAKSARVRKNVKSYYPIVYRLNGGKHPKKQKMKVKRGTYISVSQLKKPTRRGYKFVGWYTNKKLTQKARKVYGRGLRTSRMLYAKWKLTSYRVSYELNGGTAQDKLPTRYTVETGRIALGAPVRKGYAFAGWYADKQFTKRRYVIPAGSVGDKKFYAKWNMSTYSITYDLDGGVKTLELPSTYTVKSSMVVPFPPTKSGYRFVGWYSDAERTEKISCIEPGSAGDVTLYAKWDPATYWDEHLDAKCTRVNELSASVEGSVPGVVFITDMHVPSNTLVSPYLIREVLRRTDTNMVVFGGDAINGQTDKTDAVDMLRFIWDSFPDTEVHFVRGNHDANTEGSNVSSKRKITADEFLEQFAGKNEDRESGSLDCCRDDSEHKVRYIFMDSGAPNSAYVTTLQLAWLKDRVLELEEGWTVLLFIHQFFKMYPGYDACGKLIKRLLDQIYDDAKAEIAGVISGHVHHDRVEFSSKGYPMISTACDAYAKAAKADASMRRVGTTTEQAFDVISLNTKEKMVYLTRVGAGEDRAYRYAEVAVDPDPGQPDPDPGQPDPDPGQPDSGGGALQAAGAL
ncbi:MAG: InlB B-repeat-containing protein [Eggerthellaceae bacterium]|nr:InlB B-repeat-containing protein [Eggerthellaceae bacterium]